MLCRICLKSNVAEILKIYEGEGLRLKITDIIHQHFGFVPEKDDGISDAICLSCWRLTITFHKFYVSVIEAQKNLLSVKLDPNTDDKTTFKTELQDIDDLEWFRDGNAEYIDIIHVNEEAIDNLREKTQFEEDELKDCKNEVFEPCKENENNDTIDNTERVPGYDDENSNDDNDDDDDDYDNEDNNVNGGNKDDYNVGNKVEDEKNVKSSRSRIDSRKRKLDHNKISTTIKKHKIEKISKGKCLSSKTTPQKRRGRPKKTPKNESDSDEDIPLQHLAEKQKPPKIKAEQSNWLKKSKEDDEKIAKYMKLKCEVCGIEYVTFAEIKQHYRIVHNRKGYVVCCNKKLYKRVLLLDHVNKHINPEYFKCEECNKILADKQCLKNHMLRHESDESKIFKCDQCPRQYAKKYLLDQHKFIHIPPEERQFICDDCGKAYGSAKLLQSHKRSTHEQKYKQKHVCEICAKTFTNRPFFEKHQMEEHLGLKLPPVQCHICKFWSKNAHSIRAHMKIHREAHLIHECDICGKKSPSRKALLKHRLYVHLRGKDYKCSICEKAFKRAIALKEHMTTHTGEILYTCTFCPKTFNSNANMHSHRKRSHPIEWAEDKVNRMTSNADVNNITISNNVICRIDNNGGNYDANDNRNKSDVVLDKLTITTHD